MDPLSSLLACLQLFIVSSFLNYSLACIIFLFGSIFWIYCHTLFWKIPVKMHWLLVNSLLHMTKGLCLVVFNFPFFVSEMWQFEHNSIRPPFAWCSLDFVTLAVHLPLQWLRFIINLTGSRTTWGTSPWVCLSGIIELDELRLEVVQLYLWAGPFHGWEPWVEQKDKNVSEYLCSSLLAPDVETLSAAFCYEHHNFPAIKDFPSDCNSK